MIMNGRRHNVKEYPDFLIERTMVQYMVDGVDTTGDAMILGLYFIATNPDVQEKLRDEINEKVTNYSK